MLPSLCFIKWDIKIIEIIELQKENKIENH